LIGAEINLRRVSEGDGKSPSMSMASSKRKSKQKMEKRIASIGMQLDGKSTLLDPWLTSSFHTRKVG
jgi:hypothetical protein